jgi:hypothetical protein
MSGKEARESGIAVDLRGDGTTTGRAAVVGARGAPFLTIPTGTFLSHGSDKLPTWYTNWIASLPLILLTVLVHVSGLAVTKNRAISLVERAAARGGRHFVFALIMGCTVVLVTVLHAIDAAIWGVAYILLGALPDSHSAMLYSLGAMTTFGNTTFNLEAQWQLMGVVESLNGVILFGLTVATLFSINDRIPAASGK